MGGIQHEAKEKTDASTSQTVSIRTWLSAGTTITSPGDFGVSEVRKDHILFYGKHFSGIDLMAISSGSVNVWKRAVAYRSPFSRCACASP